MTQLKRLFFYILTISLALTPGVVLGQQQSIQISVIRTFDFPGTGNSTTPLGINDRGDIVGTYVDASNVRRGFIRFPYGVFQAIVAPNDTGNFTFAGGISNFQTISGFNKRFGIHRRSLHG